MSDHKKLSESNSVTEQPIERRRRLEEVLVWVKLHKLEAVLLLVLMGVLFYFYGFRGAYGNARDQSAVEWMWAVSGDKRFDYFHGRLIPLLILGLFIYRWPAMRAAAKRGESWGLVLAIVGVVFYILSERVLQARIAAGSIPIVVFGLIIFLWGRHVGRYMFFPCCLIYFAIPVPGLMQATSGLQIFSTKVAAVVGRLFQIDLVSAGSRIVSASDKWQFEVDEGCSGIRSLVALTLIAATYGHLTQDKLWKKVFLIFAALPLAVVANAARVSTIVLIAEYVDSGFAGSTYHNWSGFVFFFAVGLCGLLFLSKLINGELRVRGKRSRSRLVGKNLPTN